MNDSDKFIKASPDIKLDQHIRLGSRFKTHIEINFIDIKKAEITWITQTYLSQDPPMSYRNSIKDHGSTKLALSKFANAHSMAFLGMVLLLGSMIFDQVA